MFHATLRRLLKQLDRRSRRTPIRTRSRDVARNAPWLEALEDRIVPSTFTWTNLNGGDWDTSSNWADQNHNPGVPGAGDDAVIPSLNNGASVTHNSGTDSVRNLTLDANLSIAGGSLAIVGTSVLIDNEQTITIGVQGSLSFGTATVAIQDLNYDATEGITVSGTLTATGTTFNRANNSNGSDISQILVNTGGNIVANNCTFGWDDIELPAALVPSLTNNVSFQDVDIAPGSLASPQSVTIGPMGTSGNLRYVFPGAFEVKGGASLSIADNANVLIRNEQTITVDAQGSLSFGAATVSIEDVNYGATEGITVSGTLTATGTTFNRANNANGSDITQILVNTGGSIVANNCTFGWDDIELPAALVPTLTNNVSFHDVDIAPGSLASPQSVMIGPMGTSGNLRYVFPGAFEVKGGASLSIADNANVLIRNEQTMTVDAQGSLSFGAATVSIEDVNYGATEGITVSGTLTATGTTFNRANNANGSDITQILVNTGGSIVANNCTFGWDDIELPAALVPLLTNNVSFQDVDIAPGSLASPQSVTIGPMGTSGNLRYVFPGAFEVKGGASLSIADNANVLIRNEQTMTVDALGSLSFGAATVSIEDVNYGATEGITVSGTLTATGTTFNRANNSNGSDTSQILVNTGGNIVANNCTFGWDDIELPAAFVPSLTNNVSFQDVDIAPGSLASPQSVTIGPMGTSGNLRYVFPGAFEVKGGASLSIADNANVLIRNEQTMTVDALGSLSFGAATVSIEDVNYGATEGITVSGTLTATGTTFNRANNTNGSDTSQILVNTGGNIVANNCTFGWDDIELPAALVPSLTNNVSFQDVDIAPGSLASPQSVTIGPMGTSGNLRYVFPGAFEVKGGASLSIADNANVLIRNEQTITVDALGSLSFGATTVSIEDVNYGATEGIAISGTLTATGTTFNRANNTNGSDTSQILVNTGGNIVANNCTFGWDKVTLNTGSTDNIQFVDFAGQLAINSGATIAISGNDFSNVGTNGIIASGLATATINLTNNYWGTTNATAIGALILDHNDDATRPTVNFQPPSSTRPTQTQAAAVSVFFSTAQQSASLSATVYSPSGTVNEGMVTFTILSGSTPIGTAVSASVMTGKAKASYTLPANTAVGAYTIQAVYSGTSNYQTSTDTSQVLSVAAGSSTTQPTNATAIFDASNQDVVLTGSVTSPGGPVNGGSFTFTVAGVGAATSATVSNGSATATFVIPGGTDAGSYAITTAFSGSTIFPASSDDTGQLTIGTATTTTNATNSSAGFDNSTQTISLTGTVTSAAGPVNGGSITFNVAGLGSAVSATVSAGTASASFTIPGGTAAGSYAVTTSYNGSIDFAASSDNTGNLTVGTTSTTTDPTIASSVFNSNDQTVTLVGTVDTENGSVNGGTFLFTIASLGFVTSGAVSNGTASATFTIPGGTAAGSYTITTSYNGTTNFTASSDSTGTLTVALASTAVAATTASATFSGNSQTKSLTGSITSAGGPVNGGTFTFTIVGIDSVTSGTVSNGMASASLTIPGGASPGSYTITTSYSGSTNFAAGSDNNGLFTVSLANTSTAPTNEVNSFSSHDQTVTLTGTVNAANTSVNGGTFTFTVAGLGSVTSATVSNGTTDATFTIPGGTAVGSYTITTSYSGSTDFAPSDDATGQLTIEQLSLPDLVVTGVSAPAAGYNSQDVLVSWTDMNQGAATATGPWVDNVYVAINAQGNSPTLLGSFIFSDTLAAGASVERTQQIALPPTAGIYWFAVTTNATQSVLEEGDFGNNATVAASSIAVTPVPLPDLVVTSITQPANGVFSGTSVPISFVVKNQGAAPTSTPVWHDWVILSQDPTLGQTYQGQLNPTGPGGDQTLNNQPIVLGVTNPSYLGIGESYQQNLNVTLPINAQGTWYVYVVPDGTGFHHPFSMPEASRTDKLSISGEFTVTLSPWPDLAVTGVIAPPVELSGQPMTLSWTVANQGMGPTIAGAWTDAVYMSSEAALDSSATELGTFNHRGALAAGESYTDSETVTIPAGINGQFYFLVKTDAGGAVFENGELANNVGASTVRTVSLTPPPDLDVASVTAPDSATPGHALAFAYQVSNIGANYTPNSSWLDFFYLSPTATYDSSTAISLGEQVHNGGLAAGANYNDSVSVTLPAGISGSFFILVDTDSANQVLETSKANNWGASASPVQIAAVAADLVVSSASAPTTALPGTAILVNWTIANQGTSDTAAGSWQDDVYVDASSTLDDNGILLGAFTHTGLLDGGDSYTQSQLVTIPISILGDYNLFVVANATGAVHESNVNNNTFGPMPIAITLQSPSGGGGGGGPPASVSDLQVTSVTGPGTALTGASVTINWTVQNNGPGPTNSNYWYDDVWMSTNQTLDSGGTDVYLGSVQHTNVLAASDNYQASGTFRLPNAAAADSYYFIVATDRPLAPPNDDQSVRLVYETNYANNELAASAATTVAIGQTPELSISNVTAPSTAVSAGQLAISWTVTNSGADTGAVPITDSVYLSYDQVLDRTDRYIGSVTHVGGLAGGASYTQNASLQLPSGLAGTFYVFVVTNSNNNIFEQNPSTNTADSPQPVQINLPAPVDLIAGAVTIPANAFIGENITITYQVSNNGNNPANGSWVDSLYLSSTPTWNVSNPLLGKVSQTRNLVSGASYTGTLTAPVPGVGPGSYYVIVRTNILDSIPESTLSNNISASITQSALDAPALTLGTPVQGTMTRGESFFYKVQLTAGQTLEVDLQGADPNAANELYVSYGTMPSRTQSDYRFAVPFNAQQQILVPSTKAGAYYVLVYADSLPSSSETYTLTASIIPFGVLSIDQTSVGNSGNVTIGLLGSKLDSATSISLTGPDSETLNAQSVYVIDGTNVYATFDTTGAPTGPYSLTAKDSSGDVSTLSSVLQIVQGFSPPIDVNVVSPSGVRADGIFDAEVIFKNTGNVDTLPPILRLESNGTALLGLSAATLGAGELDLLGRSPTGPGGVLRPGESVTVTVVAKALVEVGSDVTLQTTAITATNTPVDPNAIVAAAGLPSVPFTGESDYVSDLEQIAGATNAQFLSTIQQTVSDLNGSQGNGLGAVLFVNAWNDELGMVAELWNAQNPPGPTPPPPTYTLPTGQNVSIQTYQTGAAGAPVYYITAGYLAAESYGPNDWALDEMVQGLQAWTAMAGSGGVKPTIKLVLWNSGNPTGLATQVAAGQVAGGLFGAYFAGIDYYDQASANVPAVGQAIANDMVAGNYDPANVTLIGHSLGGQASFTAGFDYQQSTGHHLQTIEALDPAGPGFPVNGLYADAGAAVTVNTYNTSPILGEYQNMVGAMGHNYFPDMPLTPLDPLEQDGYAHTYYAQQVASCNLNPAPHPDQPLDTSSVPQLAGGFVSVATTPVIAPHDPNTIIGPDGSGEQHTVPVTLPMPYQIQFQNQPSAGAAAQQVVVTQQLDSTLNWQSFRLGSFGFDGMTFNAPANSAFYQTTIDLTATKGYLVDLTATIDVQTGIATWTFTTIDPATGEQPIDPTIGLLPPDDANGSGEGFVNYTILPNSSDQTGDVVNALATVIFDTQPPLDTQAILNTLDTGAGLTSTVAPLPAFAPASLFNVSWSGSDASNGSALSTFDIYVSVDGGAFNSWLEDTTLTTAAFQGQNGHSYGFFSIATDNAGNVQAEPSAAQASTLVGATAPAFTSADSTTFTVGANDTFTLTTTGFPTAALSESGVLPTGVTFDAATGILSGTPAAGANPSYTLTFTASNGVSPDATQSFTLTIDQSPAITNANTITFALGIAGAFTFTATGFPAPAFSESGNLPTGVTFVNGVLSGTPSAGIGGSYPLTITASNGVLPNAVQSFNLIVTAIQPGSISGTVFHDYNLNGKQDSGDLGLAGQTIFLDLNNNDVLDSGEPTAISNASGAYNFTNLAPGTYVVREILLGGVIPNLPSTGSYSLTITSGSNLSNENFADVLTSITVPLTLPPTTSFPSQHNANADYVEAIYRAVLDRNADPGGLASWTAHLNDGSYTRLQVVQGIRNSPEHFGQEIDVFYHTLLGRTADPQGRASWVQQLENGVREEQIAFDFLDSPEYLSKGDKYFVDAMYLSLLGRAFDPNGEASWFNALGDDSSGNPTHAATLTHAQVINDFLFSAESLDRLVEGYYEVFLQRQADPGGLKGWVTELQDGLPFLTIGQGFISSDEFYNKAAGNN